MERGRFLISNSSKVELYSKPRRLFLLHYTILQAIFSKAYLNTDEYFLFLMNLVILSILKHLVQDKFLTSFTTTNIYKRKDGKNTPY